MNSQICVQCKNFKPINSTDNRLVTESCGHVKCMDCLLRETAGCNACLSENCKEFKNGDKEITAAVDNNTIPEEANTKVALVHSDNASEITHIIPNKDEKGDYYFCTKCNKKCQTRSQLAYHAYCNGQRKPYQCTLPHCGKSFVTRSHYKYHMRVHRNEKTYSCDVCRESFFQMSKLQRHKLKHSKEKNYVCTVPQCKKAFNNVSSLKQHWLVHSEERPYECKTCGARFRDRSNHHKHVAKHDACRKDGPRQSLVNNGRFEYQRRMFQCPRCPQAFHSAKDMRRHSAVHSDSKPFRCKICPDKCFRRKDNLERHIRNSHPQCVTATAIEVDQKALAERLSIQAQDAPIKIAQNAAVADSADYMINERNKLKILNPLPPLSQEVIERTMLPKAQHVAHEPRAQTDAPIETSYILEANNARESVIFGPISHKREKMEDVKKYEYVHKIRRAHSMVSQKVLPDVYLPPVNQTKMIELEEKTTSNNLDVGSPPRNVELYKKILTVREARARHE